MPDKTITPYDINAGQDGNRLVKLAGGDVVQVPKSTARLPQPLGPVLGQVIDADSYVKSLHIDERMAGIGGSLMEAAKALGVPPQAYSYSSMAFMPDTANAGLMQWPGINPDSLRKICRENIAPRMVFNARVNDIARYALYAEEPWHTGWHMVMRDRRAKPSAKDRKDMEEAARFLANCMRGDTTDPRDRDALGILPFDTFLRALVDDMYTFDAAAVWTNRARSGYIEQFTTMPAGNVRLANPRHGYQNNPKYFAALLDETGSPVVPFTRDQLVWKVQYPRTDPAAWGYGWPIPEQAARLIQAYQSAIDLNANTFDKSGIPNAILKLKGEFFNQDQIDAMMREWNNMKRGVSKMWGMPIIAIPEDGDIDLLNLNDVKGEEVRYRDHMNMMVGAFCIVSNFPVRRLGLFSSGHSRDNMPVPGESVEVQGVDDPGLPPLLTHLENIINPYLVWAGWPHLSMEFRSKDPKSDARDYEMRKQARTWGESRTLVDDDDLTKMTKGDTEWLKPVAEIMSLCPEDPSKAGIFQSLAVVALTQRYKIENVEDGVEDGASPEEGGDAQVKEPGARFPSKKDPAQSLKHGHRAGVRRSAREEARQPSGDGTQRREISI